MNTPSIPISSPRWAITVALPHESQGLLGIMKSVTKTQWKHFKIYEAQLGEQSLVLLQTGMGLENASVATKFLLQEFSITHLISTGYCGGLVSSLKNAEALLADSLCLNPDKKSSIKISSSFFEQVQSTLSKNRIPFSVGRLVSSQVPVLDSQAKLTLAQNLNAQAIDMESFAVMEAVQASKKEITSLTLRFVLDTAEDQLSDPSNWTDDQARLKPWGLLKTTLKRPKVLMELPLWAQRALQARRQMVKTISLLLKENLS